jgi:hypothetical protein
MLKCQKNKSIDKNGCRKDHPIFAGTGFFIGINNLGELMKTTSLTKKAAILAVALFTFASYIGSAQAQSVKQPANSNDLQGIHKIQPAPN